jgi:glycosyltransferase involved in cell wall biosynthesis
VVSTHDLLLMPSRFEGFPFGLLEAMAAGCIPVVSRIAGVTDFVIQHEESGWLFGIGDTTAAARGIDHLGGDAMVRSRLSEGARAAARRFRLEATGEAYAALLTDLSAVSLAFRRRHSRTGACRTLFG